MVSPELVVCTLGHLASVQELRARGVPAGALRSALARGALTRVSRGRYGCAHLGGMDGGSDRIAAARAHARIGCVSALRLAGVWAGDDSRLHLQLRPGQHGTGREQVDSRGRPIVYHWSEPFTAVEGPAPTARPATWPVSTGPAAAWHARRLAELPERGSGSVSLVAAAPARAAESAPPATGATRAAPPATGATRSTPPATGATRSTPPATGAAGGPGRQTVDLPGDPARQSSSRCWLVEPMEAVWRAIHCLDEENAIACLESAVHEGYITTEELRQLCAAAPEYLQAGIAEIEFTADSGQETIVRRRLRRAGFRVVAQETPKNMPPEDLVVEDCVDLETDGKLWHGQDRFHADRDRDLLYEGLGRRVLRITQRHILNEWETTLLVITRVVEDAQRAQIGRRGRPLEPAP